MTNELTPRELVRKTLRFEAAPRVPRQLWTLPWAQQHYPKEWAALQRDFPDDILIPEIDMPPVASLRGDPFAAGTFVDEWGCTFVNVQDGVIGEVKHPLIDDYATDLSKLRPPDEWLRFDHGPLDAACAATDRFTLSNPGLLRLFERMQFLRGTENLLVDLLEGPAGLFELRDRVHDWNLAMLDRLCATEVDAIGWMDDWGSQRALLVNPQLWREFFKPCYREYLRRIKAAGKLAFMHSDGHIFEIIEDLIEIGVDALNAQLFCMDLEGIGRRFKGRITFWGEIDRQNILPTASVAEVGRAVRRVAAALYDGRGGVIAQCEFGVGARPENVRAVFAEWGKIGQAAGHGR